MTRTEPLDDHLGKPTIAGTIVVFVESIWPTQDLRTGWQSDEGAWIGWMRNGYEMIVRSRDWRLGGANHQNRC